MAMNSYEVPSTIQVLYLALGGQCQLLLQILQSPKHNTSIILGTWGLMHIAPLRDYKERLTINVKPTLGGYGCNVYLYYSKVPA